MIQISGKALIHTPLGEVYCIRLFNVMALGQLQHKSEVAAQGK
ncbi:hypothetical protein [Deinococcus sp. AJ005]|nr:hypothetical protein [Deinococcus sp. AJ005]